MLNIKIKQQRVLKEFQKHVEYILAPALAIAKNLGTARQTTLTSPERPSLPRELKMLPKPPWQFPMSSQSN